MSWIKYKVIVTFRDSFFFEYRAHFFFVTREMEKKSEAQKLAAPKVVASGDSIIKVQWEKVRGAILYEVQVFRQEERYYYRKMSDFSAKEISEMTTSVTSGFSRGQNQTMILCYTLPTIEDSYQFRVRAQTSNQWSPWSDYSVSCCGEIQGSVRNSSSVKHFISSSETNSSSSCI